MSPVDTGVTHDRSGKTAYDWSKLNCEGCDVWAEIEIPKEETE